MSTSHLSRQISFSDEVTEARYPSTLTPAKRPASPKMSISQTYFLAHSARGKLSSQAARPDHDLRRLVGHANMLDALMLELADAEREQEHWFDQTVKRAAKASSSSSSTSTSTSGPHVQWHDTIVEEPEDDWAIEDAPSDDDSSDGESDSDADDEDVHMATVVPVSKPGDKIDVAAAAVEYDDADAEDIYEDDESDTGDLALVRTSSHSPVSPSSTSPPELLLDADEESDSDSDADDADVAMMPPSPPNTALAFSEKQRQGLVTTSFYHQGPSSASSSSSSSSSPSSSPIAGLSSEDQAAFFDEGYFLPQRSSPAPSHLVAPQRTAISAC